VGSKTPKTPEMTDEKLSVDDYVGDDIPHTKTQNSHWGRFGIGVKYHPRVVFSFHFLSFLCSIKFCRVLSKNRRTDSYAFAMYVVIAFPEG